MVMRGVSGCTKKQKIEMLNDFHCHYYSHKKIDSILRIITVLQTYVVIMFKKLNLAAVTSY